jgi:type I restriction enzyme S subunit
MSWKKVKIGDFLKRSKIPVDIEDNQYYKRVTIRTKHQGVSLRDEIIGKKIGTKKQFILKKGQFVLSKIDARYGAFGIAPNETDGAIITGNFWAYDVDKSIMNIKWFNQYTNSRVFYDLCERASSGITHRKYLNENFFLNHELIIPKIEEQVSHVQFIKSRKELFGYLEYSQSHQLDLLKKLRQQILQDAIQGKLVPQDPNDEPASVLLERIKAEKEKLFREKKIKKEKTLPPIKPEEIPFEIPENWVWCRLGDICTKIGSGSTPKGSNYSIKGYPFFRSQNIHDYGLVYDDIKFISNEVQNQMAGTIVEPSDLLLNITGGSLGRCAYVPNDFVEGNVSQHVCIIRPIFQDNYFIHKVILSPYFQTLVFESTTGAGREGLPKYNLEKFIIPIPSISEQYRIATKTEQLMTLYDELEQSVQQNQKYIQELLQVALKEALEPKS